MAESKCTRHEVQFRGVPNEPVERCNPMTSQCSSLRYGLNYFMESILSTAVVQLQVCMYIRVLEYKGSRTEKNRKPTMK